MARQHISVPAEVFLPVRIHQKHRHDGIFSHG
jgi:hypothetical protein